MSHDRYNWNNWVSLYFTGEITLMTIGLKIRRQCLMLQRCQVMQWLLHWNEQKKKTFLSTQKRQLGK